MSSLSDSPLYEATTWIIALVLSASLCACEPLGASSASTAQQNAHGDTTCVVISRSFQRGDDRSGQRVEWRPENGPRSVNVVVSKEDGSATTVISKRGSRSISISTSNAGHLTIRMGKRRKS